MHPLAYLRETLSELKLVRWPSRAATIKLTVIVIAISLAVGIYVGSLDYLLTNLLKSIIQ